MISRRAFLATLTAVAGTTAPMSAALGQWGFLDKAKESLGGLKELLPGETAEELTTEDIVAGLREALEVGSRKVVAQLGVRDGFNLDPDIHIPLPGILQDVQQTLGKFGLSSLADDLELRLNRAAEVATPQAEALFLDAIKVMTLDDARGILDGPDDAATQYFKGKMSEPLAARMTPIVKDSLSEVGAIAAYDTMMGRYQALPLVPDVKADLAGHVVTKGLEGIFYYVAKEEAAIRNDPARRTTEILKRVFGA